MDPFNMELLANIALLIIGIFGFCITLGLFITLLKTGTSLINRARDLDYDLKAWWSAQVPSNDRDGCHSVANVRAGIGARRNKNGDAYVVFKQAPIQND